MAPLQIVIVSPALADANNGNWQTARRWQKLLAPQVRARIVRSWPDGSSPGDQGMLALHARKSAPAIQAWADARGPHGLAVVLTGTDLYRDIAQDAQARQSLEQAQALVVLHELGTLALPAPLRSKARTVFQSTSARSTLARTARHLRAVMVGHLRDEKDPRTLMQAARLLTPQDGICIDHLGAALDPALGTEARQTALACPFYRWLGGQPHEATRRRIQRAHVLVHASRMEGGAHVVMEAVCSGTPVLASRIPGNVGMLGADYAGYFEPGDPQGLIALLRSCRATQGQPGGLLATLAAQCAQRAHLFDPSQERQALHRLVTQLASSSP